MCMHQSLKRHDVFGWSHESVSCILLRTASEADMHSRDCGVNELIFFSGVATSRVRSGVVCICLVGGWVPYHKGVGQLKNYPISLETHPYQVFYKTINSRGLSRLRHEINRRVKQTKVVKKQFIELLERRAF